MTAQQQQVALELRANFMAEKCELAEYAAARTEAAQRRAAAAAAACAAGKDPQAALPTMAEEERALSEKRQEHREAALRASWDAIFSKFMGPSSYRARSSGSWP